MPRYLEVINQTLIEQAARHPGLVQFGENIAQGSRLCGVARNLTGRVVTVGNCENTHVGVGLGMMSEGGQALLIVKQLDFLLLGMDQMVNTLNLLGAMPPNDARGSFTILTIVCDQGWQGPQSSFNDLAGLCALARINGYFLNGQADSARVLERHLVRPGFRIIAVSQRRFGDECLELPLMDSSDDEAELQYSDGDGATIVSLGFTLAEAAALAEPRAALFQINPVLPHRWPRMMASAGRTRRLIVLDDSKGGLSLAHKVASVVLRAVPDCHVSLHTREDDCEFAVNPDRFMVAA